MYQNNLKQKWWQKCMILHCEKYNLMWYDAKNYHKMELIILTIILIKYMEWLVRKKTVYLRDKSYF